MTKTRTPSGTTDRLNPSRKPPFFWHQTFRWCLLSVCLYWLAFPPVNWWLLAWLAPLGWIRVICQKELTGRRPLLCLYLVGWIHWLSMTYWVTLPHPLAAIGWLFLSAYLAAFFVGFILLARWLVHRNQIAAIYAVPIAWVTMEVLRTYLFTGFGLVPLSHSQVGFLPLIQIAKVTGAYGVSFVVMMCATAISSVLEAWQGDAAEKTYGRSTVVAIVTVAACLAFGYTALQRTTEASGTANVAIIQGALDTEFAATVIDARRIEEQRERAFADYSRMTSDVTSNANVDLVLWPESMFWRYYGITRYDAALSDKVVGPKGMTMEKFADICEVSTQQHIRLFGTNCLMGSSTTHHYPDHIEQFNTAAYYDGDGRLQGVYHKMHPVMFGEYIPFGDVFPWLYNFAPIPGPLTPGAEPKVFPAGTLSVAPCICFENTVPQLIRRNLLKLARRGAPAQSLVTLTNDGWFWGSGLLEVHLACGIFRAIENRRPMLIAANTGISAHIDDCGRVVQQAPKRVSRVIVAEVKGSDAVSFYTNFGDLFGFGCIGLSAIGLFVGKFFS